MSWPPHRTRGALLANLHATLATFNEVAFRSLAINGVEYNRVLDMAAQSSEINLQNHLTTWSEKWLHLCATTESWRYSDLEGYMPFFRHLKNACRLSTSLLRILDIVAWYNRVPVAVGKAIGAVVVYLQKEAELRRRKAWALSDSGVGPFPVTGDEAMRDDDVWAVEVPEQFSFGFEEGTVMNGSKEFVVKGTGESVVAELWAGLGVRMVLVGQAEELNLGQLVKAVIAWLGSARTYAEGMKGKEVERFLEKSGEFLDELKGEWLEVEGQVWMERVGELPDSC